MNQNWVKRKCLQSYPWLLYLPGSFQQLARKCVTHFGKHCKLHDDFIFHGGFHSIVIIMFTSHHAFIFAHYSGATAFCFCEKVLILQFCPIPNSSLTFGMRRHSKNPICLVRQSSNVEWPNWVSSSISFNCPGRYQQLLLFWKWPCYFCPSIHTLWWESLCNNW